MRGWFGGIPRSTRAIVRLSTIARRKHRTSPWAFFKSSPRILPYLRPHKRLAGMSLGMVGASSAVALLSPWPLALLIDTVLGNKPLPSLLGPLGDVDPYTLLVIAVLAGLIVTGLEHGLAVVDDYVNTKLDQSMVLGLRSDLFRHAQRLSLAFHDKKRTGQLMYQINNQAAAVGSITVSVPPVLQSLVTLVGMFAIVYKIESTLALLSLTVVPFIYYSAGYYARRIEPRVIQVRNMEGQSLAIVHEAMAMMRVIVAFGRERYEYKRFRKQGEEAVDARVRLTVRQTMFSLAVTMITATGTALVLGFGAHYVLSRGMTAGELLVVMGYISSMYKPLEQISNTVSSLQEQFIGLRGALELLDTPPEIEEKPDAIEIDRAGGEVEFQNVSFDYEQRKGTLKDVSFHACGGRRVAVVGPTGAGKSTLLSLLPRFYDPREGRILLDGHDLRDLTLASLRAQISVVLQEPLLFSGSIRENIRYGRLEATEDEIIEAAKSANAHDFIAALPRGYDTPLGERGAQLSGGERQRISVARAFLKDAPILILDEPTSSIDSKTEAVILEALERLMENRTTFMVAHRLSTIESAELILVVNHGEIVEQGTHEQLLVADGLYRQLHDAQQGARRRRAAATVSADGLSDLTKAIAEARESGRSVSGPALAALARAMAARELGDTPEEAEAVPNGAWRLIGAAWPLLQDGSADHLRDLAATNGDSPEDVAEAADMARQLLVDLGLQDAATRPHQNGRAVAAETRDAPTPAAAPSQDEAFEPAPPGAGAPKRQAPAAAAPERSAPLTGSHHRRSWPPPGGLVGTAMRHIPLRAADGLVDLNTARVPDLARLPGVGRQRAKRIVEERGRRGPFRSVEDLLRIEGFNPDQVRRIAPRVRAGAVNEMAEVQ